MSNPEEQDEPDNSKESSVDFAILFFTLLCVFMGLLAGYGAFTIHSSLLGVMVLCFLAATVLCGFIFTAINKNVSDEKLDHKKSRIIYTLHFSGIAIFAILAVFHNTIWLGGIVLGIIFLMITAAMVKSRYGWETCGKCQKRVKTFDEGRWTCHYCGYFNGQTNCEGCGP